MYDDIRSLSESRTEFLEYLGLQLEINRDRNSDWFPRLIRDIDKYLFWTICFRDNKIVAFSAIQSFFFPKGTARILTRTFFDPSIRLKPGYNLGVETPVAPMAKKQLEWLKEDGNFSKVIITMERRHRHDYFLKIIEKINKRVSTEFVVSDQRIQTYENQEPKNFQYYAELKF